MSTFQTLDRDEAARQLATALVNLAAMPIDIREVLHGALADVQTGKIPAVLEEQAINFIHPLEAEAMIRSEAALLLRAMESNITRRAIARLVRDIVISLILVVVSIAAICGVGFTAWLVRQTPRHDSVTFLICGAIFTFTVFLCLILGVCTVAYIIDRFEQRYYRMRRWGKGLLLRFKQSVAS